jgi:hypothetical protein
MIWISYFCFILTRHCACSGEGGALVDAESAMGGFLRLMLSACRHRRSVELCIDLYISVLFLLVCARNTSVHTCIMLGGVFIFAQANRNGSKICIVCDCQCQALSSFEFNQMPNL